MQSSDPTDLNQDDLIIDNQVQNFWSNIDDNTVKIDSIKKTDRSGIQEF